MERLSFDDAGRYDGLEASIHMARYSLAHSHCQGKRVLDVACGEGYGSRLLKNWGATEVYGIDVSSDAISHAQKHFSGEGVQFYCAAAENLLQLLVDQKFDLIVSLETIEHLENPEKFLSDLKCLLNPGGCIIVSCPNDNWYFPLDTESNPYHLKKYQFEDFRSLTENVLGPASTWLLGAPTFGFLNSVRLSCPEANVGAGQLQMMQGDSMGSAQLLPAEFDAGPKDNNASYFVGIWGGEGEESAALLPLSMDAFKKGIFQGHLSDSTQLNMQLKNAQECEKELRQQLDEKNRFAGSSEKILRNLSLQRQAILGENQLMRQTISQLKQRLLELDVLQVEKSQLNELLTSRNVEISQLSEKLLNLHIYQIGYNRYMYLRRLVPAPLRSVFVFLRNLLR
jgi:SAM-dependent methyltransferase